MNTGMNSDINSSMNSGINYGINSGINCGMNSDINSGMNYVINCGINYSAALLESVPKFQNLSFWNSKKDVEELIFVTLSKNAKLLILSKKGLKNKFKFFLRFSFRDFGKNLVI